MLPLLVLTLQSTAGVPAAEFPYQRWSAAAESRVGFRGESTLHGFEGECSALVAGLHADLGDLARTAGGEVSFRVADLATGKEDRDENMRSDLEADRFPTIAFRLDHLEGVLSAAGAGEATASGVFLIHGVDRSRSFPAAIERLDGGRLRVRGELRFLQTEHGIEPHSTLGLVKVHDEVEVWFDLTLAPPPAAAREGSLRPVRARAETRVAGADPVQEEFAWRMWSAADAVLLDGGAEWWLAAETGARLAPAAGRRSAPAPDAEAAFVEARVRLAALESRLADLPAEQRARAGAKLEEAIARLRRALEQAPAEGEAEILRAGDDVEIRLGGRTWARLEGLAGSESLPTALAEMPHVPGAVRAALRGLRGVPRSAFLLTATESGSREWRLEFGDAAPARIPAWALDAAAWPMPAP